MFISKMKVAHDGNFGGWRLKWRRHFFCQYCWNLGNKGKIVMSRYVAKNTSKAMRVIDFKRLYFYKVKE